eukprot:gnl/TRDRNA2_/TRDRNA2_84035_c0_seq1.p1 gnl/TRDRNA2_/TRDRNA2_84035_c0~~gnl/TRDRNA2_/TRDRNA2_84035_c0_seq1.p1  ORF type:complete len:992 (+),score=204.90 gnl/TRDRNA2_/TRDRNA2_84035_c0_seq1:41-2977(+)
MGGVTTGVASGQVSMDTSRASTPCHDQEPTKDIPDIGRLLLESKEDSQLHHRGLASQMHPAASPDPNSAVGVMPFAPPLAAPSPPCSEAALPESWDLFQEFKRGRLRMDSVHGVQSVHSDSSATRAVPTPQEPVKASRRGEGSLLFQPPISNDEDTGTLAKQVLLGGSARRISSQLAAAANSRVTSASGTPCRPEKSLAEKAFNSIPTSPVEPCTASNGESGLFSGLAGGVPLAARRQQQGKDSPTVDMHALLDKLETILPPRGQETGEMCDIPEGRRSFAAHVAPLEGAAKRAAPPPQSFESFVAQQSPKSGAKATSSRGGRASFRPFGESQQKAAKDEVSSPSRKPDGMTADPVLPASKDGMIDFSQMNRQFEQEMGLKSQQSRDETADAGLGRLPDTGAPLQADDSPLDQSNDQSMQLPGNSEFQLMGSSSVSRSPVGRSLSMGWDEFLSGAGVTFQSIEALNSQVDDHAPSPPTAAAAHSSECSKTQRVERALMQQRTSCLQEACKELTAKNNLGLRQYKTMIERWNNCATMPPSAQALIEAMPVPENLEVFKSMIQEWKAFCKDDSWLGWYKAKKSWLLQDCEYMQTHSRLLKQEIGRLQEVHRRLEECHGAINSMLRQQHHRSDIRKSSKRLLDLGSQELRATQEEHQFIKQKVPEAQAMLVDTQESVQELEQRVQAARQQAEQDRIAVHQARKNFLRVKLQKVELERQRYAHTCEITKAGLNEVCMQLRGGSRVVVSRASSGDHLHIMFEPPRPSSSSACGTDLWPSLGRELLVRAWHQILRQSASSAYAGAEDAMNVDSMGATATMQATIPTSELERLLRRLDVAALRAADLIQKLRGLRSAVPEVARVVPQVCNGACGPALVISVMLCVVHSHSISAERGVEALVGASKNPDQVDSAQCVLEFHADLNTMLSAPEGKWTSVSVRQVLGAFRDAAALEHALRCAGPHGGTTIAEALAEAVEVMRRAAPPM